MTRSARRKATRASGEVAAPAHEGVTELRVTRDDLVEAVRRQLSAVNAPPEQPIIWTDGDAEVVFYPASVRLSIGAGLVLAEARFASDQIREQTLVIPFSVGSSVADAALLAVTEDAPRGHRALAARWGTLAQDALWCAVLRAGEKLQSSTGARPALSMVGLFADTDAVTFLFAPPLSLADLAGAASAVVRPKPAARRRR